MAILEVKDMPGLVRDTKSGAVIYTDSSDINKRKERKSLQAERVEAVDRLQGQVENLQNELGDIKQLLIQMIEKNNG